MKKSLAVAIVIITGLISFDLKADGTVGGASVAQGESQANPAPKKKSLSASLLIDTSATLAKQNVNSSGEDYSYSGFYRFDLGTPLSERLTATMRLGYSQEYSYALPDNSFGDLTDIRLGLTSALGEVRKDLKLSVGSGLILPTSKESQRAGLKSALSLNATLTQKLKRWTFICSPALNQFFHDLEVQNDGKLNIERSASLLGEVDYAVTDRLQLSLMIQPTHSWTYRGTTRDSYLVGYDMGFEVNKNVLLNLGIFNKASALKSNGLEYNYALFDEAQFMGYFDVTLIL